MQQLARLIAQLIPPDPNANGYVCRSWMSAYTEITLDTYSPALIVIGKHGDQPGCVRVAITAMLCSGGLDFARHIGCARGIRAPLVDLG